MNDIERAQLEVFIEQTKLAMYRARSLYGRVVLSRAEMMRAAEDGPGAFWRYAQQETARALGEVEAEARRAGIRLQPYDPERFTESVINCSGGYATAPGREVRVPTRDLVPRVRIVHGKEEIV